MKLKGKKVKKVLKLGGKGKEMEIGDDMLSVSLKAGGKKVKAEISPEGMGIFGSSDDLIALLKELEQKVKKEEVNKNKT
jgi:hypothetical protein